MQGALIIRIGFGGGGVFCTIIIIKTIIRDLQNPILIIQAPPSLGPTSVAGLGFRGLGFRGISSGGPPPANDSGGLNTAAIIIRIKSWDPLYYHYRTPPQKKRIVLVVS